jgi:uncharacterized repeat protein (TIGR01451 family)
MSDRPSRQALVVPQKRSNLPLMLGAVASGCAGFAAVWSIGLGRSTGPDASNAAIKQTVPAVVDTVSPPDSLDMSTPAAPAVPSQGDRYAVQPTSLDRPNGVVAAAGRGSRFSRFASAEDLPVSPANAETPADEPVEPAESVEPEPPSVPGPPPAFDTASTTLESTGVEPSQAETEAPPADQLATVPADGAAEPLPEDAGDLAQPATTVPRPQDVFAPPAPAPTPEPAAPAPRANAFSSRDIDPPASFPLPDPASDPEAPIPHQPNAGGAALLPMASVGVNPLRANATAVPFAAAPPLAAPPQTLQPAGDGPATSAAGNGSTGQGRPGPMQLEGVQTPQLSVEKRGPREVQVGKAARYEIIVRNVGSATAHDCVLRDSVPVGTTLIATTPPASPASQSSPANPAASGSSGDLLWMLGSLAPGGQARVAMEVMPTTEGDVGSVASVTFRADASVRSRATKPALFIEAADPKPVLIGRDVSVSITISNPGTGIATGVVLEGALPEQLSHRAGRELEFDVGQLQPGGSRTIDLSLGSMGPGVHTIRLVGRADGQIETERMLKIEVTAPTLELSAEMPARRYLQRPATCRISMANTGTAPAKSVELAAQLPPGMKFVRANNAGFYDERGHRVLWNLEELPAGEIGTVELVVMPIELGPQKIVTASRSADGLSDQVANTIEVEGLAAISFEVADSEDPIEVGGLTEYVVRVRNQGTKSASGVRLTATLLGELEPVEAKGPAAHRIENLTVGFEPLAKLAPAEEAVFRIRVRGHREGDQRVQVQLTSDDHPSPITKEEITRVYADR